jgi:hypothetical protein
MADEFPETFQMVLNNRNLRAIDMCRNKRLLCRLCHARKLIDHRLGFQASCLRISRCDGGKQFGFERRILLEERTRKAQYIGSMFVACFDAGGKEDSAPCITVAGFVAPVNAWIEFEQKWKERLAHDGLTYFHMVDFAHSTNEFSEGWKGNEPRRRRLLSDLMEIIVPNVSRKFSVSVESGSLEKHVDQDLRSHYLLNAFVLGARACAGKVLAWARRDKINTPIEFVFEEGDSGKGKLIERFQFDGFGTPIFRYKKDTTMKGIFHEGFTPLHAADFLAYEMFQVAKRRSIDRWGWEQFRRVVGEPGFLTADNLDNWNMKLRVSIDHARWYKSVIRHSEEPL